MWCTGKLREGEEAITKAEEECRQAEMRTAMARTREKEATTVREQAEAAVVEAREREEEAQVERAHAEAEESKVKAATAAMVAARKRMEEMEAEFRRAEAEMAAARSRAASRMRAEAVAESDRYPGRKEECGTNLFKRLLSVFASNCAPVGVLEETGNAA